MDESGGKIGSIFEQLMRIFGVPPSAEIIAKAVESFDRILDQSDKSSEFKLVSLAPFLISPVAAIRSKAADTIEAILANSKPALLLQVDQRMRRSIWDMPDCIARWDSMVPSDLRSNTSTKTGFGLCAMASFHRNGYVRQAAVTEIAKFKDGRELPFLIIRLSDWIEAVNGIAAREIEKRFETKYASEFVNNLALLERIRGRDRLYGRYSRQVASVGVQKFLIHAENRAVLMTGLKHCDVEVRRCCFELVCAVPDADTSAIVNIILKDLDLTTRRRLFKLADRLASEKKIDLLKQLARDKAGVVRRDALKALCEELPSEAPELVRKALLDKSMAVREYARWKLLKVEPEFDVVEFYRGQIQNPNDEKLLVSAICGLGENGKTYDASLIAPLLECEKSPVQRAAIRALANLDASNYLDSFVRLLGNEDAGLSRAAALALEPVVHLVDPIELWETANSATQWYVKRRALSLLNGIEKWERIVYLLQALASRDSQVQDYANNCLDGWQGHYGYTALYTLPSRGQQARIEAAVEKAGSKVSHSLRALLKACMEECRGRPKSV